MPFVIEDALERNRARGVLNMRHELRRSGDQGTQADGVSEEARVVVEGAVSEGLALVNMRRRGDIVGHFLGHARAGWWGGLLAGLCFVLPAFFIMVRLPQHTPNTVRYRRHATCLRAGTCGGRYFHRRGIPPRA